ncbi:MAG: hypothetical protein ABI912_03575 [Actinomycetota bacterium]
MGNVYALPGHRDWFIDDRGDGRRMQVTWHPEHAIVVLSLWHRDVCTSTFRLPIADAPRLITLFAASLGEAAQSPAAKGAVS